MNITDLKSSLPYLFKAQITPFIWSHAGLGKTSVVKKLAKDLYYHFFALYLGTQSDSGDILGLHDFVKDEKGNTVAVDHMMPLYMKKIIEHCEQNPESGAILFLDEFNRARRDILQGMFSLALDKTFHNIKLPSNCYIVAAGNPPTEEYYVTDVEDTALMARFCHIKLEPTFAEWQEYAKNRKMNHNFIGFLSEQPDLLADAKSSFKPPVKVDNRSWDRLDDLEKAGTPGPLFDQLMQGIVGIERTVAYMSYLKNAEKPLTSEEVFSGKHFEKIVSWADETNVKTTLFTITYDHILTTLKERDANKTTLNDEEKKNLMAFLVKSPKETAYSFFRTATDLQINSFREFINKPEYQKAAVNLIRRAKGTI